MYLPKDGKLVLLDLGSHTARGTLLFKSFPSSASSPPGHNCHPALACPCPSPAPFCSPQQDTGSGVLGLSVVEGRHVLQGAFGVPTEVVHQAPVGTQGAADQLAPGRNAGRDSES